MTITITSLGCLYTDGRHTGHGHQSCGLNHLLFCHTMYILDYLFMQHCHRIQITLRWWCMNEIKKVHPRFRLSSIEFRCKTGRPQCSRVESKLGSMSTKCKAIPKPSATGFPASYMTFITTSHMQSCNVLMARPLLVMNSFIFS